MFCFVLSSNSRQQWRASGHEEGRQLDRTSCSLTEKGDTHLKAARGRATIPRDTILTLCARAEDENQCPAQTKARGIQKAITADPKTKSSAERMRVTSLVDHYTVASDGLTHRGPGGPLRSGVKSFHIENQCIYYIYTYFFRHGQLVRPAAHRHW